MLVDLTFMSGKMSKSDKYSLTLAELLISNYGLILISDFPWYQAISSMRAGITHTDPMPIAWPCQWSG